MLSNKPKSLHFLIIGVFTLMALVTYVILAVYVVYDYREELKSNLRHRLSVMAEDVVRHQLYIEPANELKDSFEFFESYHETPSIDYLDSLGLTYEAAPPEQLGNLMYVVKLLPDGRYLVITSSMERLNRKSFLFMAKSLLVFGTVLLLFILLFNAILAKLLSPLQCLVRFCNESTLERSSVKQCHGTREINNLRRAIINLLNANRTILHDRQDVFREAAHEIKTPIAILKARLSLFKQRDDYDKIRFISECEGDIATVSNKLKELLFLKAVELDMYQKKEEVSMREQCYLMQQKFQLIREKKGLMLKANWSDDFMLKTHKEAMQKVMQALFENIFFHTKNDSTIHISVDAKYKTLRIENETGSTGDEKLFSSFIGSKLIERLSEKLGFKYHVSEENGHFYTTVIFGD